MSAALYQGPTLALVPPLWRADAPVQFWPDLAADRPLWLVLPASDCPVRWVTLTAATPRQAAAAARAEAAAAAIDPDVHVVAEPADGPIPVATVAPAVMRHWLAWAAANGYAPAAVIPAAIALPEPGPGGAASVALSGEHVVRQEDRAFAAEPDLVALLPDAPLPTVIDPEAALLSLSRAPLCNLLTGPYAPPRARWFTRERLQAAAAMTCLILLLSLAIGVARLARVHADIARIDGDAAAAASAALGREVSITDAVAELDARLAATGRTQGSATATLAALLSAMEPQPGTSLDAATWTRAGTWAVTIGAARNEDINPVLTAVQARGYRITAQPRQGGDGRVLADVTIRSEP